MFETVICEVQQFLYQEARLLDERRFHEWLDLFADDVDYRMICRSNRYPKSSKSIVPLNPGRDAGEDAADRHELTLLDETKETLAKRIARLETGMAWAEDPPSRTRHLINNIEVQSDAAELEARCNFIVYRSRSETEQDFYVGARRDLLRRADGSFKIASRKLVLDQNVLLAKNVSIFF